MSDLNTLRTAKQALDEGLITQEDFDSVKQGFLNAQRIKAGLDAGFIPEEDFAAASAAFFESLGVHSSQVSGSTVVKKPGHSASVGHSKVQNGSPFSRPGPFGAASTANSKTKPHHGGLVGAGSGHLGGTAPPRVNSLTNPAKPVVASSKVSMSGISVDENAVAEFNQMKGKSMYLWMMFKIDDTGRTVVLSEFASKDSDFNEFVGTLPPNECRYAVFDYAYETSEGRNLQKLVFINWAPDTAPVKAKMMFASTKDFFKNALGGAQVELQITDIDDITDEDVAKAVANTLTRG